MWRCLIQHFFQAAFFLVSRGVKTKCKGMSHHCIPSLVWVKIHRRTHALRSIWSPLVLPNSRSGRQLSPCLIHQHWIKSSETLWKPLLHLHFSALSSHFFARFCLLYRFSKNESCVSSVINKRESSSVTLQANFQKCIYFSYNRFCTALNQWFSTGFTSRCTSYIGHQMGLQFTICNIFFLTLIYSTQVR